MNTILLSLIKIHHGVQISSKSIEISNILEIQQINKQMSDILIKNINANLIRLLSTQV